MAKSYKHLFFDLDHTLWDFERNSEKALRQLHSQFELQNKGLLDVDGFILRYKQINAECWKLYREGRMEKEELRYGRFRRAFEEMGVFEAGLDKRFGDGYVDLSPRLTELIDGAKEVLEYLQKRYILHIITNGFKEIQHIKLSHSGIAGHFAHIIVSEDVGAKKPDSRVFQFALNRSGALANESLMIGDDLEADIVGARNAGMEQVYYNPAAIPHREEVAHEITHLRELLYIL